MFTVGRGGRKISQDSSHKEQESEGTVRCLSKGTAPGRGGTVKRVGDGQQHLSVVASSLWWQSLDVFNFGAGI